MQPSATAKGMAVTQIHVTLTHSQDVRNDRKLRSIHGKGSLFLCRMWLVLSILSMYTPSYISVSNKS